MALQPNGGKVVCMFSAPPTMGVGKVGRLDDAAAIGTDRERKILSPDGTFYSGLADLCCSAQVRRTATHCDMLQHAATCCNTLQC